MTSRRSRALTRTALFAVTLVLLPSSSCVAPRVDGEATARAARGATTGAFGAPRESGFSRLQREVPPATVAGPAAAGRVSTPTLAPLVASQASSSTPELAPEARRSEAEVAVEAVASRSRETLVTPEEAPAPRPADPRLHERQLREDYATARDPVGPALRLAAWLADRERHDEGLFVLQQAMQRSDEVALRLAHAGLLRDTGRNQEAAQELQAVVHDRQRHAVSPGTLLDLAQVELLAGQRDQARRTYAELLQVVGDEVWFAAHGEDLALLRTAIEQPDGALVTMRDLLALLRSASSPTARVHLIDRLLAPIPDQDPAITDERRELHERVLVIGCGDPSPAVRARTLRAAAACGRDDAEFWRTALADEAALVRSVAAGAVVEVLGEAAGDLLLAQLENEVDASAFAAVHHALERVLGSAAEFHLTPEDEDGRAAARAMWRQRGPR